MNLLYFSCHSILEYDELKLFSELGLNIFSHGTYKDPQKIDDPKRPILNFTPPAGFADLIKDDNKMNCPQEIIDWADVIIFMHRSDWVFPNLEKMKGKRVILRTIGQNTLDNEIELDVLRKNGVEIVRYSPREKTIPGYAGESACIRFYKDPEEFNNWNGADRQVLNISQDMINRDAFCNFQFFEKATSRYNRMLIGKGSEAAGLWGVGIKDYDFIKEKLRNSRVYFYTGTYPASYTLNFIEAAMTGTPMVALGPIKGNSPIHQEQQTYEIPDYAEGCRNLFLADTVEEAAQKIGLLLDVEELAQQKSAAIRAMALKYFAKDVIKDQWKKYLGV
ncbi:MAG: glycosyltransferase family 1 protein [Alphaproteobacteria bacterium]|nr:MAG: glycosyltransferase family 1 protein [Alphaproteobacteria bacterium]